jgi:signal transduction histidine kinase
MGKHWSPWHARGRDAGAIIVVVMIASWPIISLVLGHSGAVGISLTVQSALEASIMLTRFFAALVLLLLPRTSLGQRLYWLAGGFVLLGIGSFGFGYLRPLVDTSYMLVNENAAVYAFLSVCIASGAFLNVGLLPKTAFPRPRALIVLGAVALGVAGLFLASQAAHLPSLVAVSGTSGVTPMYRVLALLPLTLALTAAVAGVRHCPGRFGGWIGMGLILNAGAQWHNLFWPTAYNATLTMATLLRFSSGLVVLLGAVLALRRLLLDHATLLTIEQEYSKRLGEMAILKADFTAMVAHEFGAPIAAIRACAEMAAIGALDPHHKGMALATIQAQTDVLTTLVNDVRTAATAERDDFAIRPRPIAIGIILADAAAFARTLPGEHPCTMTEGLSYLVRADPERIGQVLRNLLGNAAKYSAPGTPIELCAIMKDGRVRLQVADRGFGIHPHDLTRVFEKYGRGRDEHGRNVQGVGLGLYLSRRIAQAHGTDLSVESFPGIGSVFGFDLEIVQ